MSQASELIAIQLASSNINKVNWGSIGVNVKVYGAVGDGVTDDTLAFTNAMNSITGEGTILLPPGTYRIASNMTIPSTICTYFTNGGMIAPGSGTTVTINGEIIAELTQIFTGLGTIAGSMKVTTVYPQWFGAKGDGTTDDAVSIQNAINAIDKRGKLVLNKDDKYKILSTVVIPSNKEIVIEGNGAAVYSFIRNGSSPAFILDGRITGDTIEGDVPSSCRVVNLTIIGGSPTDHSHPATPAKGNANGFEIYNGHRFQMENVKVLGFDKKGIYINNSYYVSFKNVLLRYNREYGFFGENTVNDGEFNIKCEFNGVGARLTTSTGTTFQKPLFQGNYQNGLEVYSSQGIVCIDPYVEQNNVSDTAGLCNISVTGDANGDRFTLIGGRFAGNFETFFDGSPRINGGHQIICGVPNLILNGTKFTSLGTVTAGHEGIKFVGTAPSLTEFGAFPQIDNSTPTTGSGTLSSINGASTYNNTTTYGRDVNNHESMEYTKNRIWYNSGKTGIARKDQYNAIFSNLEALYLSGLGGVIIAGGTYQNPINIEGIFLWRDGANGVLRKKNTTAPTSDVTGDVIPVYWNGVPASSTAAGTIGMIAADANYLYFCIATNSWIRCARSAAW